MLVCYITSLWAWGNCIRLNGIYVEFYGDHEAHVKSATGCSPYEPYYSGDFVIPSTVPCTSCQTTNDAPITGIELSAFNSCSSLTSLTLPKTIVGFIVECYGCSQLMNFYVDEDNPYLCSEGGILFNKAKTSIVGYPRGRQGEYTIPSNVTNIGNRAFYDCDGLTSVTIPNSVTNIESFAFAYCSSLTSITIPDGVTRLAGAVFNGCSGLKSVTIPNGVTYIDLRVFDGCTSLTNIYCYAPNPPVVRDTTAFRNVSKSTCILYVPTESVEAYRAADVWKEFTNILSIGGEQPCLLASGHCGGEGDGTNLTWELGCDSVLTISGTGAMADYSDWPISNCAPWYENHSAIKSININSGVTTIGEWAFYDCSSQSSVTIPNSVTSIGTGAFYECSELTSVTIPNSVINIGDGVFWGTGLTYPIYNANCFAFMPRSYSGAYAIPDGIKQIAGFAFQDCANLASVTIPNSVVTIGRDAFGVCNSLTSIEFPNSVTSIGNECCVNCQNLVSIIIGSGVISIGNNAFEDCLSLTDVYMRSSFPPVINANIFADVDNSLVSLHVPCGSIATYQAADVWKTFWTIVEDGCKYEITWQNYDETILKVDSLLEGVIPSYSGDIPIKSATAEYTYTFAGWKPEIVPVTGNATYTAVYDSIRNANPIREGALPGEFSVSATSKVHFSQGNLQYNRTSKIWRFAESQYSRVSASANQINSSNTDWIDLFAWGSSGYKISPTAVSSTYYNYYVDNTSTKSLNGTKYDWGVYCKINNGGNIANRWRTLTSSEWDYLINQRANANSKSGLATVNGIEGLILLPDVWEWPDDCQAFSTNEDNAGYDSNIYTLAQWTLLEKNGAVFLPVSSYRTVSESSNYVVSGNTGMYWAASVSSSEDAYLYAYHVGFKTNSYLQKKQKVVKVELVGSSPLPQQIRRYYGFSVRLVQNSSVYDADIHTITWKQDDGTTIDQSAWPYGSTPTHENPYKDSTEMYAYSFIGWTPTIVPVTGDATYTATYDSTKIEYNIDITIPDTIGTHGTVIIDGEATYGDTITLTAIPEEGYHFVEWNDGNTDNPRQIIVVGDTAIYPIFAKDVFLITFVNYNGIELQSDSVEYGAMPAYNDETPQRLATAQYTYSFKGWKPEVVAVTGNAVYTAEFDSVVNQYTITFNNYDGTELQSDSVAYGAMPAYNGETPIKPATTQYTYSFIGWKPEVVAVTGNAVYTAEFDSVVNQYTITFNNYDGTQLQSSKLEYGAMPAYNGETPIKPATAQYTYSFKGWKPEVVAVTGDAIYTAEFDSVVNQYTITFNNYDGTQLQSGKLDYGAMPAYNGETPQRLATAQYTYTFAGWKPEVVAVTGNAVYTAEFDSVVNQYTITFNNYDGTQLQSGKLDYGVLPTYNGAIPTKPSDKRNDYTFSGWSPAVVAVTGDATYTAQFDATLIIYNITTEPATGEQHGSVDINGTAYYEATVTLTATPEDGYYFVSWNDGVTDNPRQIVVVSDTTLYPIFKPCEPITTNITATIYDDGSYRVGDEVFTTRGTYRVTLSAANGCDSVVVLRLNVIKLPTYNVRVEVNNESYGSASGAGIYKKNQEATLTATPKSKGNRFTWWYNSATQEKVTANPYTFTVTEDVLWRAVFSRAVKTITIEYRSAPRRMTVDADETYAVVSVSEKLAEINNISGETYYLYDASGKLITSSQDDKQYTLPSGMYIIRIEDQTEKFIVP